MFTVGAVAFGREIESEWSVLAFVSADRARFFRWTLRWLLK